MGNGVEHSTAPFLVRFEDGDNVGGWRVGHQPAGTQRIGSVNEHITKSKLWWQACHWPVSGVAKTFHQFGYRLVSRCSGQSVDRTVGPETMADDLPDQGRLLGFPHRYEVTEDVADTPAGAPRGRLPLIRRQSSYPVGELDAKAANFCPGIHARGGPGASLAETDRVGPGDR
jgi:hypothetical protein